jgi:hypothetical protein
VATGPGIVHEDEGTAADDPLAEINKDEWNKAHAVKQYYDIVAGAAEPATPAAGKIRHFFIDTGTTPNRRLAEGLKLDDGQVIWIYDLTV